MQINSFSGEYRFLSNFFPSPIHWCHAVWPTVEHAYQAGKVTTVDEATAILNAPTPGIAKRLGGRAKLRPDWEELKFHLMLELLLLKFAPGTALADRLVWTRGCELVEGNTWGDTYWGVCRGEGQNNLGRLLMHVRKQLDDAKARKV